MAINETPVKKSLILMTSNSEGDGEIKYKGTTFNGIRPDANNEALKEVGDSLGTLLADGCDTVVVNQKLEVSAVEA